MFKDNKRQQQPYLISNVNDLSEKHQKRLATSWAGVFYRETFSRLDERPFGVLYADFPSRPNIPVNVLVGLESLKADFEIEQTQKGVPAKITCPQAQTVAVHPSSQKKGFVAHFDPVICQKCSFYQKTCPARPGKRDQRLHLNFNQQQANGSQRRRRSEIHKKEGRNLRAAIEATVREIKHPFPASKLPVRGRFRVACMVIGSALATNAHRIQRYLVAKIKAENKVNDAPKGQECSQEQPCVSFIARLKAVLGAWRTPFGLRKLCVSF